MASAFQVDLRGIVELLAHHLYSSPKVYLRELLQNAVDALSVRARGQDDGDARPGVLIVPADASADGDLYLLDSGQGLDESEVREFLATIGRSSKRDELGFARSDLLGQFGIGLLSCFLVTDRIELWTRSAKTPEASTVHWLGHGDGTYELSSGAPELPEPVREWLAAGPGTGVRLSPRRDSVDWMVADRVTNLARSVGAFLPQVVVVRQVGGLEVSVAPAIAPWRIVDAGQRRAASIAFARDVLDVEPLSIVPIAVPEAGLVGFLTVLGRGTSPGARPTSRVHLKGMLLGQDIAGLLPDWAFFTRGAFDATGLRPTASREALYEDDLLETVRQAIGDQLRRWLRRLADADPAAMTNLLALHARAMKSAALHDDELLRIVLPLLKFDTSIGAVTLAEFRTRFDVIHVVETVDEYRHIAPVAAAQGIGVINGGWTDDGELVRRLVDIDNGAKVVTISPTDLGTHMGAVTEARAQQCYVAVEAARTVLAHREVEVELRDFVPTSMAALYLDDSSSRTLRQSRELAVEADDAWAGILGSFDDGRTAWPRLVLNDGNETVRRVLALTDPPLLRVAVETLYCRALMLGYHPMQPADRALMDQSFLGLLDRALRGGAR